MKSILLLALCGLFSSFPMQGQHDWLLGEWQRTNDDAGLKTYEIWEKANDTTYVGLGFTLSGKDTVFMENLTLVSKKHLEVLGVGGGPVLFSMTESSDSSFAVVNMNNEFPKRIDYRRTSRGMEAVISGEGREVLFTFKKKMP
jgi:hypothetical protein